MEETEEVLERNFQNSRLMRYILILYLLYLVYLQPFAIQHEGKRIMLVDSFKKENNELVVQFNLLLTEVSLCQKATFLNFIICKSNPGYGATSFRG